MKASEQTKSVTIRWPLEFWHRVKIAACLKGLTLNEVGTQGVAHVLNIAPPKQTKKSAG